MVLKCQRITAVQKSFDFFHRDLAVARNKSVEPIVVQETTRGVLERISVGVIVNFDFVALVVVLEAQLCS